MKENENKKCLMSTLDWFEISKKTKRGLSGMNLRKVQKEKGVTIVALAIIKLVPVA